MKFRICMCLFMLLGATAWSADPGDVTVLQDRVCGTIEDFIRGRIEADSLSVVVTPPNLSGFHAELSEDAAGFDVSVAWERSDDALAGSTSVPFVIEGEGRILLRSYTRAVTRLYSRVCVAARFLNRSNILKSHDVRHALMDVTTVRGAVTHPDRVIGQRTRRIIGQDRIITETMIEPPPVIDRGDRVQILLSHRNIELKADGFAREDGWAGDAIRVRYANRPEEITALVKEAGTVFVPFERTE